MKRFDLCLRCGQEKFDELLTSAPPRHPRCGGVVVSFDDVMNRAAVWRELELARAGSTPEHDARAKTHQPEDERDEDQSGDARFGQR